MLNRHTLLCATLATGLLALTACTSPMGGAAASNIKVYEATLSSAQEVPPNSSPGKGTAEVRVNTDTNELTWKVEYSGLTGPATMAHIHGPAAAGANAPVVVPFPGVAGQTSASGTGKVTQAQYGDLAAGLYYVNVHTAQNPGGEIRGQLTPKK